MKRWVRFRAWFGTLGWVKTLALMLTGALFALAGAKALKKRKSAFRKETAAIDKRRSHITKDLEAGKALADAANKDKKAAIKADEAMKAHLEKLGENESIADIADRFNKRELRKSIETPAPGLE